MDAISGKIYLEKWAGAVAFCPEDWVIQGPFIHHQTRHIMFQIMADRNTGSIYDLYVRVNHVCDGYRLPEERDLNTLGREAIACFLWYMENLEQSMNAEACGNGGEENIPF